MGRECEPEGVPVSRDTICAPCTAPGRGVRSALRLSGPRTRAILEALCREEGGAPVTLGRRRAVHVALDDGEGVQPALLLWMPGPASYTREDVGELHLIGHPGLVEAALSRVLAAGARAAGPGEFTRRAFENGALDLAQAEGVLAVVEASTEEERRAATRLLLGGLSRAVEGLRDRLAEARALLEASLDFDELDTGHVPREELTELVGAAARGLEELRARQASRPADQGRPRLVLAGPPNAGKSSLFNRLLEGTAEVPALVHPEPGSTRDARSGVLSLGGLPVDLVDTAGLEAGHGRGALEDRAQEQARRWAASGSLVLWLRDASAEDPPGAPDPDWIEVWTKLDLEQPQDRRRPPEEAGISTSTGEGIEELLTRVRSSLEARSTTGAGVTLSQRHLAGLAAAGESVALALAGLRGTAPLDLLGQELRSASDALDALTGHTSPEDLLDRIFSRFCLGK